MPQGATRSVPFASACWKLDGSAKLVTGPGGHLSLVSGCKSMSAASVRLPIGAAGRFRVTWRTAGGEITGACASSALVTIFAAGPTGKAVLAAAPLHTGQALVQAAPLPEDRVHLQIWVSGGLHCGGNIRLLGVTVAPATSR